MNAVVRDALEKIQCEINFVQYVVVFGCYIVMYTIVLIKVPVILLKCCYLFTKSECKIIQIYNKLNEYIMNI